MTLSALADFTQTQKYSKYLPSENRRETWPEIIDRALNTHLNKFRRLTEEDKAEIIQAFDYVKDKKVLPSMRWAQFGGVAVEKANLRGYNCAFLHVYNSRCIEKIFYMLLCGTGVGFSVGKQWVKEFPIIADRKNERLTYVVPDSIEGWANSVRVLIDSYLTGNNFSGLDIIFDYTAIRPKGSPISHGGTAPGPEGLKHAHEKIRSLLNSCEHRLSTVNVYDIIMHVSDAVLSGGIRRAACLALFDKDDHLMLTSKSGNWFKENPQRARSNNTMLLKRDEVTLEDFENIVKYTRQWGEPGFAFVDDLNTGLNPCCEISFLPFYNSIPSVQVCNLTTINGNKIQNEEDFYQCVKSASIIGTLQASYTDFGFLDPYDEKLTEEEALLGVSIMGYMSNPEILLDETILANGAKLAVEINEGWAKKLGINPAARVTCTKPDGNSSCALGSPFSGIHPAHAKRYFRRVQVNKSDPVYQHFKKENPHMCQESIYSATKTDDVITFPIEVESENAIYKSDLTALEHLEIIKKVNKAWVKNGEKNNKRPVSHSISCTVLVAEDEWDLVIKYLYENREGFTTVSLLPRSGDKDYAQAPYEAVATEEDELLWDMLVSNYTEVDYTKMNEGKDNTKFTEERACAAGYCEI